MVKNMPDIMPVKLLKYEEMLINASKMVKNI